MSSGIAWSIVGILIIGLFLSGNGEECVPREFGSGNIVCVCNSTYCDSTPRYVPERGQYEIYETSKDGKRMDQKTGSFNASLRNNDESAADVTLALNHDITFQTIHGFGGAFTDSAGINIKKLSDASQHLILEAYFGKNGSRYTLGRVPVAGTDFSTRPYTYDDHDDDVTLEKFDLAPEDREYKIPFMKKALELSPEMKFLSSSWTAPPWMKTNKNFSGYGFLEKQYYQVYAEYLVKFLTEYKNSGVPIWAITTGNEPDDAAIKQIGFNSMGWTPETMSTWVAHNFGPTIDRSESHETLILTLDDQRFNLPSYPFEVFRDPVAKKYIAGIALHWYFDDLILPNVLDDTHFLFPDKFLIMTEGCVGDSSSGDIQGVMLGNWRRAELYIVRIIENLNHWMTGFIDWNLVLDKDGGPTWAKNYVDAPIIVNPENDEFFKQPMYYALEHLSKFIVRGSKRISADNSGGSIDNLAFMTPADETVIILYNRNQTEKTVLVKDRIHGDIETKISPYTIQTIIYKN